MELINLDFLKAINIIKYNEDVNIRYIALSYLFFEINKIDKISGLNLFKKELIKNGFFEQYHYIEQFRNNRKKYKLSLLIIFFHNNIISKIESIYKENKINFDEIVLKNQNNNSNNYKKFIMSSFLVLDDYFFKGNFNANLIKSNFSSFL